MFEYISRIRVTILTFQNRAIQGKVLSLKLIVNASLANFIFCQFVAFVRCFWKYLEKTGLVIWCFHALNAQAIDSQHVPPPPAYILPRAQQRACLNTPHSFPFFLRLLDSFKQMFLLPYAHGVMREDWGEFWPSVARGMLALQIPTALSPEFTCDCCGHAYISANNLYIKILKMDVFAMLLL